MTQQHSCDEYDKYLQAFGHYFVPDHTSDHSETCLECRLNLRDPIHYRVDDIRLKAKED